MCTANCSPHRMCSSFTMLRPKMFLNFSQLPVRLNRDGDKNPKVSMWCPTSTLNKLTVVRTASVFSWLRMSLQGVTTRASKHDLSAYY